MRGITMMESINSAQSATSHVLPAPTHQPASLVPPTDSSMAHTAHAKPCSTKTTPPSTV